MITSTPILHLGLGRFHRAHQAVYFQRLKEEFSDDRWTISAFSMRSNEARDALRSVQCRYPVIETAREGLTVRSIDRIREVGSMSEDRELFLAHMRDPVLEIVSLTVTEKGYCLDVKGELDLASPEIRGDLERPDQPTSAIGILSLGLAERAKALRNESSRAGLTVICCDNLRSNGVRLQNAVKTFLEKSDRSDVTLFLRDHVAFPSTMVDRIVPSLSKDSKRKFEQEAKLDHAELIATETFSQWVIEDRFARPRPPLEKVGVEFVLDVRPHEEMKLRLLNAAHSFIAYVGLLRGHSYVHEVVGDPELRKWIENLLFDEAGPMLGLDVDWKNYATRVLKRFENSRLPHSLQQIAMDGSQKIPQRILPTIAASIAAGAESPASDMAVASWIAFMHRELGPDSGHALSDPLASRLKGLWQPDFKKFLRTVGGDHTIFGELAGEPGWIDRLARAND